MGPMRPENLCGLLAEPVRLQVFAAVVLGAAGPGEVAARTGLAGKVVVQALGRLEQGGLVSTVDGSLRAKDSAFKEAVRESAADRPSEPPLAASDETAAVLRVFVVDGSLRTIPAQRQKRRIVLEHLATCFEPGVKYPERVVNEILNRWHPDHAALRRYLVDDGLLDRDHSVYHRVGGPVEV